MQQLLVIVTILGVQRDADGGAQTNRVAVQVDRIIQVVEHGLGQFGSLIGLFDAAEHQHELVTAQPRQCTQATRRFAQAIRQPLEQAVARLVAVLLVDALEVVEPQAEYGDPSLQAACLVEDMVQLALQLLAVGQAGQGVVLGHAMQAALGFLAQMHVVLDGGQQAVGGFHPEAQLVALMSSDHRQFVLAGAVRIDLCQVLDELGQRAGQQPLVDQEEHQPQGEGAQNADDEDDDGVVDEFLAVLGRVQRDPQFAVILVVGRLADQRNGKLAILVKDRVGQPAGRQADGRADLQCQHAFVRVADRGHANRFVLEQAFHHLRTHFPIQAVDGLGGRIARHAQDALGIGLDQLARLVGAEDDLRAAEHQPYRQRR